MVAAEGFPSSTLSRVARACPAATLSPREALTATILPLMRGDTWAIRSALASTLPVTLITPASRCFFAGATTTPFCFCTSAVILTLPTSPVLVVAFFPSSLMAVFSFFMGARFFILVAGFLMFGMLAAAFQVGGTIEKAAPMATARIIPIMITFLFTAHLR